MKYKGTNFSELDIDAILARKPAIVIVDELAHSNVAGSRHPKRWQDVMEILDHGIDVYTTLNVQHIESCTDVVESIAGIKIRETVPDLVIDRAAFIELVDITPEELLRRLKEGKVYLGDQSAIAARHFFQEDRLTALREIVMRYAAEKVDHDLHGMFSSLERTDAWKPRERLLVAVSHNTHSQKLIRITRRLAFTLNAPWIALHVDDGRTLDEIEQKILANNLALARDLGAEVITVYGDDVAQSIQRIARQKSVTQIIIGRSPESWGWLSSIFQPESLLDRLARECSDIDLHVIRKTLFTKPTTSKWKWLRLENFTPYLYTLFFVLGLTLFNTIFLDTFGYRAVGFSFLLGILFLTLFLKKGLFFFATLLFGFIWFFLFIPAGNMLSEKINDLIALVFYFLIALFAGILTDRVRRNKEMLIKREKSIDALYEIVQGIAGATSLEQVLAAVKSKLNTVFDAKCEIILKKMDNGLIFEESSSLFQNEKEQAAAYWVLQNQKEAGWSTSTLPFAQYLYIPLKGGK